MAKSRKEKSGTAHDETDALFQLPLAEFTAARNALASRLKKGGHGDAAAAVKSLSKPSLSAWVVNQLYWQKRPAFDRLLDTGDQFRRAQADQIAGKAADMRAPLDARREALSDLTRTGADLLQATGHTPTPDIMRRVTTTLEALSTYGGVEGSPQAGRLLDDVDPPGFETLAALIPQVGRSARGDNETTRVLPFRQQPAAKPAAGTRMPADETKRLKEEREAQLAAHRASVQEAEQAVREARKAAQAAEATLKKAAARAKQTEEARAEAEKRLEDAAAAATQARDQAHKVAAEAAEAAQAVDDTEQVLEKAREALRELTQA